MTPALVAARSWIEAHGGVAAVIAKIADGDVAALFLAMVGLADAHDLPAPPLLLTLDSDRRGIAREEVQHRRPHDDGADRRAGSLSARRLGRARRPARLVRLGRVQARARAHRPLSKSRRQLEQQLGAAGDLDPGAGRARRRRRRRAHGARHRLAAGAAQPRAGRPVVHLVRQLGVDHRDRRARALAIGRRARRRHHRASARLAGARASAGADAAAEPTAQRCAAHRRLGVRGSRQRDHARLRRHRPGARTDGAGAVAHRRARRRSRARRARAARLRQRARLAVRHAERRRRLGLLSVGHAGQAEGPALRQAADDPDERSDRDGQAVPASAAGARRSVGRRRDRAHLVRPGAARPHAVVAGGAGGAGVPRHAAARLGRVVGPLDGQLQRGHGLRAHGLRRGRRRPAITVGAARGRVLRSAPERRRRVGRGHRHLFRSVARRHRAEHAALDRHGRHGARRRRRRRVARGRARRRVPGERAALRRHLAQRELAALLSAADQLLLSAGRDAPLRARSARPLSRVRHARDRAHRRVGRAGIDRRARHAGAPALGRLESGVPGGDAPRAGSARRWRGARDLHRRQSGRRRRRLRQDRALRRSHPVGPAAQGALAISSAPPRCRRGPISSRSPSRSVCSRAPAGRRRRACSARRCRKPTPRATALACCSARAA